MRTTTAFITRASQRGYNIVEMAILLAVVGLLAGASLIPLGWIGEEEANRAEQRAMRAHQDAILGYALTHRTMAAQVTLVSEQYNTTQTLPAGRPYLPCPDVDGDGNEDRFDSVLGEYTGHTLAMSIGLTVSVSAGTSGMVTTTLYFNDLVTRGSCRSVRGNLPWKTLGVPPADRWGNRYTYQVDDLFADAAAGFNQEDVPDIIDPRRLLVTVTLANYPGNYRYQGRQRGRTITAGALTLSLNTLPFVVCSANAPAQTCITMNSSLLLKAGKVAEIDKLDSRRRYLVDEVEHGPAYAIISHGKNGYGAVNHRNSQGGRVNCNAPVFSSVSPPATLSLVAATISVASPHRIEALNYPFPVRIFAPANETCQRVMIDGIAMTPQFLAAGVRLKDTNIAGAQFDDIVIWQTHKELFAPLVAAHHLPAPPLPVFRTIF